MDSQFKKQLKLNDETIPLWEGEKKILYWSFLKHKHLGSPLTIDSIRSKKTYFIKEFGDDDRFEEILKQTIIDANEFEKNYGQIIKALYNFNLDEVPQTIADEVSKVGNNKKDFKFNAKEVEKLGVREIFGNLVSRGYSIYYPVITKGDVPPDQSDCKGIIITPEGLLMGELLADLYRVKQIKSKNLYCILTGADCQLVKKQFRFGLYRTLIILSYTALTLAAYLIIKEVWSEILSILPNYFST